MSEQPSFYDIAPPPHNPYHKHDRTEMPTEVESAEEVLAGDDPGKPMVPGRNGHKVLWEFRDGKGMTAYDASMLACGDFHGMRREVRRLYMRGYVSLLSYTLPNPAPRGRRAVETWRITPEGIAYLREHGRP